MELSTLENRGYKARITNISKDMDITDNIVECSISLPKSKYISSMECKFNLDEKLVDVGNEVRIEILDEVGNTIYTTQGEAFTPKKVGFYTGNYNYEYQIRDSYSKLFEKVVSENITYYDLYLCNTNDKENSLLHKIAKNLGFKYEEIEFDDVVFDNGHHIRVPFIYLEENSRWVDKLQGFIESTDGILKSIIKKELSSKIG